MCIASKDKTSRDGLALSRSKKESNKNLSGQNQSIFTCTDSLESSKREIICSLVSFFSDKLHWLRINVHKQEAHFQFTKHRINTEKSWKPQSSWGNPRKISRACTHTRTWRGSNSTLRLPHTHSQHTCTPFYYLQVLPWCMAFFAELSWKSDS